MRFKNVFLCGLLVLAVMMSGCKTSKLIEDSLSIAPKDVAGKTLKVDGATIHFTSNNSGTISDYIGTATRSTVSYSRTSAVTANVEFFYHSEDKHNMSERRYTLELSFADETSGLANGSYTYSFDLNKGSKYGRSESGTGTVKDQVFSLE